MHASVARQTPTVARPSWSPSLWLCGLLRAAASHMFDRWMCTDAGWPSVQPKKAALAVKGLLRKHKSTWHDRLSSCWLLGTYPRLVSIRVFIHYPSALGSGSGWASPGYHPADQDEHGAWCSGHGGWKPSSSVASMKPGVHPPSSTSMKSWA